MCRSLEVSWLISTQLKETLFNFREELRYYADVPRFASIFQSLTEPLGLELPPAPFDGRAQANEAALRSLFDLGDDQPAPAWATELSVPSRRGASRMPQPSRQKLKTVWSHLPSRRK